MNFMDFLIIGLIIILTILVFLFDKEKDMKSKLINFFSKLSLLYFAIGIILLYLSEYIFINARLPLVMLRLSVISIVIFFTTLIVYYKDLHLYSIYDSPFRNKAQFDRFLTNKLFKHDFNLLPDTDDFLIYKKLTRDY